MSQRHLDLSMLLRCNTFGSGAVPWCVSIRLVGPWSISPPETTLHLSSAESSELLTMRLFRLPLLLAMMTALAGCNYKGVPDPQVSSRDAEWIAQIPKADEDPRFGRYLIDDPTGEAPGTIVVDTKERQLYLVQANRKAIRYGVAVGDEAYGWTGTSRSEE